MEIRTEVKTYMVEYRCPKCLNGKLIYTQFSQQTLELKQFHHNLENMKIYLHKCDYSECGHTEEIAGKKYPTIIYECIYDNYQPQ